MEKMETKMETAIPIIDLSSVIGTNHLEKPKEWETLAMEIRRVLGTVGFMQIINHEINSNIIDSVFEIGKRFFEYDDEVKMKYAMKKSESLDIDSYYGYTKSGDELFGNVKEFREAIDWGEERGQYPDDIIPDFNSSILLLNRQLKSLAKNLYRLLAIGLGLEDVNFFVKKSQHWDYPTKFSGLTNLRIAHYPEIPKDVEIPQGATRISEHTDFASLTLLFQDKTGGLEVKDVNGFWIPVKPTKDAIVINTGDLLEHWTKGIWQATPHRVRIPVFEVPRENVPSRYSITFFTGPDGDQTVTPLDICKSPEEIKKLEKLGKVYSSSSVNAFQQVFGKVRTVYGQV